MALLSKINLDTLKPKMSKTSDFVDLSMDFCKLSNAAEKLKERFVNFVSKKIEEAPTDGFQLDSDNKREGKPCEKLLNFDRKIKSEIVEERLRQWKLRQQKIDKSRTEENQVKETAVTASNSNSNDNGGYGKAEKDCVIDAILDDEREMTESENGGSDGDDEEDEDELDIVDFDENEEELEIKKKSEFFNDEAEESEEEVELFETNNSGTGISLEEEEEEEEDLVGDTSDWVDDREAILGNNEIGADEGDEEENANDALANLKTNICAKRRSKTFRRLRTLLSDDSETGPDTVSEPGSVNGDDNATNRSARLKSVQNMQQSTLDFSVISPVLNLSILDDSSGTTTGENAVNETKEALRNSMKMETSVTPASQSPFSSSTSISSSSSSSLSSSAQPLQNRKISNDRILNELFREISENSKKIRQLKLMLKYDLRKATDLIFLKNRNMEILMKLYQHRDYRKNLMKFDQKLNVIRTKVNENQSQIREINNQMSPQICIHDQGDKNLQSISTEDVRTCVDEFFSKIDSQIDCTIQKYVNITNDNITKDSDCGKDHQKSNSVEKSLKIKKNFRKLARLLNKIRHKKAHKIRMRVLMRPNNAKPDAFVRPKAPKVVLVTAKPEHHSKEWAEKQGKNLVPENLTIDELSEKTIENDIRVMKAIYEKIINFNDTENEKALEQKPQQIRLHPRDSQSKDKKMSAEKQAKISKDLIGDINLRIEKKQSNPMLGKFSNIEQVQIGGFLGKSAVRNEENAAKGARYYDGRHLFINQCTMRQSSVNSWNRIRNSHQNLNSVSSSILKCLNYRSNQKNSYFDTRNVSKRKKTYESRSKNNLIVKKLDLSKASTKKRLELLSRPKQVAIQK